MDNLIKSNKDIFYITGPDHLTVGIAAKSANRINYFKDILSIRSDEKSLLSKITGIIEKNIIFLDQVHGDELAIIKNPPEDNMHYYASADGIITDIPYICFVIRTADCVPVIIYDHNKKVLGAIHSGWKGCHLNISVKAVRNMNQLYNSDYQDIRIFLLPSICPSSYEVNNDVASLFAKDIIVKNNKIYLDLWQNIESSLIDEGIPPANIWNSRMCTLRNSDEFFSHRNKDIGRNLIFAYISL